MQLTILVGTMTGTAELVAEEMQAALEDAGHAATITMMDETDAGVFADGGVFLICSSTYGMGNFPDNAIEFVEDLEKTRPDLSQIHYGVFALGDRTYADTFCHGGQHFDALLTELGAHRIGDIRQHDAGSSELPEEIAVDWVVEWVAQVEVALAQA